jgi:hypothetical protein
LLAVSGAITTGDALTPIGRDAETGLETLDDTHIASQRTTETTPDPVSQQGIETHSDDAREHGSNEEAIGPLEIGVDVQTEDLSSPSEVAI